METPAEFDQPHVAGTTVDGRQRETRSHHRAVFLLSTCCLLLPVLLGVMAVRNLTMARSLELQYMSLKSRAASVLGQTCVHLGFGDKVSSEQIISAVSLFEVDVKLLGHCCCFCFCCCRCCLFLFRTFRTLLLAC